MNELQQQRRIFENWVERFLFCFKHENIELRRQNIKNWLTKWLICCCPLFSKIANFVTKLFNWIKTATVCCAAYFLLTFKKYSQHKLTNFEQILLNKHLQVYHCYLLIYIFYVGCKSLNVSSEEVFELNFIVPEVHFNQGESFEQGSLNLSLCQDSQMEESTSGHPAPISPVSAPSHSLADTPQSRPAPEPQGALPPPTGAGPGSVSVPGDAQESALSGTDEDLDTQSQEPLSPTTGTFSETVIFSSAPGPPSQEVDARASTAFSGIMVSTSRCCW